MFTNSLDAALGSPLNGAKCYRAPKGAAETTQPAAGSRLAGFSDSRDGEMGSSTRKGRPPRKDRRRKPCGRLYPETFSPLEIQLQKKRAMIGQRDPALAESLLGVLFALEVITPAERQAGDLYERAHRTASPGHDVAIRTQDYGMVPDRLSTEGGNAPATDNRTPEERDKSGKETLDACYQALDGAGGAARQAVDQVVIRRMAPAWLAKLVKDKNRPGAIDQAKLDGADLITGLQALARRYKLVRTEIITGSRIRSWAAPIVANVANDHTPTAAQASATPARAMPAIITGPYTVEAVNDNLRPALAPSGFTGAPANDNSPAPDALEA